MKVSTSGRVWAGFAVGLCLAVSVTAADVSIRVQDASKPFVWPANAPAPDDVTMRTLWFRPLPEGPWDPKHDTMNALRAFHATRLDWSYLRSYEPRGRFEVEMGFQPVRDYDLLLVQEKARIARVRESGRTFGGASNASVGTYVVWHAPGEATKKHTMEDINGEPLILGHMRYWDAPQSPGCVNNPHYIEGHVQYIKDYIDAGAQSMQRDEPSGNWVHAVRAVGCYCDYCMEGFNQYLRVNHYDDLEELGINDPGNWTYRDHVRRLGLDEELSADDFDWSDPRTMQSLLRDDPVAAVFVEFQGQAQADFFKIVRSRINAYYGGSFPYSCNNTSFQRFDPELYHGFDFYMSELMMRSANAPHLYERSQEARRRGKVQVFGSPKTMGEDYDAGFLVALRRKVIATSYAVGGLCQVPWDLFEQTRDGLGRYFGDPADYADLFGMVRAGGRFLTDYDDAGAYGPDIESDGRYAGGEPLRIRGGSGELYAFVRAKPMDYAAPVVVHLVDWSEDPEPAVVRVRNAAFFPGKELRITLRVPDAYDREMHEGAEIKAQAMRGSGEYLGTAQQAAYETLVVSRELSSTHDDGYTRVEVPSLSPWGILVIEPK